MNAIGNEYDILATVVADSGSSAASQLGVSCLAFDGDEEILWMGNTGGHVTSYCGPDLQRYTSFQVFDSQDIRGLITTDFGVLSLTANHLRCHIRRGLGYFRHSSELMKDMQCMTILPNGLLLMAGNQNQMIEFHLERQAQIRISETEDGAVILRKHPKYLCAGDATGKITLRDYNDLKVLYTFSTHSGTLSDFDVHGNYLITCGFSLRQGGEYASDRFLMVFDLRMNRATNPIQSVATPFMVRFVPAFASRFCVISQTGQYQLMDVTDQKQLSLMNQVSLLPGASITSFDLASTCQAMAFADDQGYIYLYGTNSDVNFNRFQRPTEFPDTVEPPPYIDPNTDFIPQTLFPLADNGDGGSSLLDELFSSPYRPTKPIDQQILDKMRTVGSVGYVQNPYRERGGRLAYVKGQLGVIGGRDEEEQEKSEEGTKESDTHSSDINQTIKNPADSSEHSIVPLLRPEEDEIVYLDQLSLED